ncbi:MAG TPA: aldehyde dehydrogenase family protein [Fontimonas sp.]
MALSNYIAGRWQAPALELECAVCDANTGRELFRQRASSPQQIESAIALAAATHADNAWLRLDAPQRAAQLERVADEILKRAELIAAADAQLTGVVVSLTSKFVQVCAGAFRQAAQLVLAPPSLPQRDGPHGALAIERLPLGPAAVIAPWNAPAGIAAHKVASALAAGCPVLLKPSEAAPLSAQLIVDAASAAGLPAGMLQLLHGGAETGAALVGDPRVRAVSFTGGLAAGRAVAAACAQDIKPAQLELGGNNPLIVLDDADLPAAIDGVVAALTTLNGQWCRALGRLLVHRSRVDALLAGVFRKLETLRIGSSMDLATEMGPLVSQVHRDLVARQVAHLQSLGGLAQQSSSLPRLPGWFFAPTLVTGLPPEQTLEEIFGPVATVHTFDSDDEAVALANQTPFGLAAYVFGAEDHAWRVARGVRAGLIKLNAVTMLNLHPQAPRPAWGLSGLGDEGTLETFEFFRGTRVTGVAGRVGA